MNNRAISSYSVKSYCSQLAYFPFDILTIVFTDNSIIIEVSPQCVGGYRRFNGEVEVSSINSNGKYFYQNVCIFYLEGNVFPRLIVVFCIP